MIEHDDEGGVDLIFNPYCAGPSDTLGAIEPCVIKAD